jgi:enoyl-[acyl-carrier protein] reductase II
LIAAGGVNSGKSMLAVMVLGADGVQIGSRFVASQESSAHHAFKEKVVEAKDGDTILTLKELAPVRLLKNKFYQDLQTAYSNGATKDELKDVLGRARAKRGMFEGDMEEGELEIGQISGAINEIKPAEEIIEDIMREYRSSIVNTQILKTFEG